MRDHAKRIVEATWTSGYLNALSIVSNWVSLTVSVYMKFVYEVAQSCPTLCDPIDCSLQAPLSMGFSRQEYWSKLPFPFPGNLPNPGIEPGAPTL